MRPKYPYYRLLGLTLLAALLLSQVVHEMQWPNWYIHPLGLVIGAGLYAVVLLLASSLRSDAAEEVAQKPGVFYLDNRSPRGVAIYYLRLVAISFVLASPFEFIASLFRT